MRIALLFLLLQASALAAATPAPSSPPVPIYVSVGGALTGAPAWAVYAVDTTQGGKTTTVLFDEKQGVKDRDAISMWIFHTILADNAKGIAAKIVVRYAGGRRQFAQLIVDNAVDAYENYGPNSARSD